MNLCLFDQPTILAQDISIGDELHVDGERWEVRHVLASPSKNYFFASMVRAGVEIGRVFKRGTHVPGVEFTQLFSASTDNGAHT